jgi:DNA-binding response OmpR family regulator
MTGLGAHPQLFVNAHDRSRHPFDRSIDIRIHRMIEVNPDRPEAIRTVRGIGYVYDPR